MTTSTAFSNLAAFSLLMTLLPTYVTPPLLGAAKSLAPPPTRPPLQAHVDMSPFHRELQLAETAPDRDSRVSHLKKALLYRPNHPQNIAIEYRIGIELAQRLDPTHNQGPRRAEALPIFEGILKKYRHMDYYSADPVDSAYDPQLMVSHSAILISCLRRGLDQDYMGAREYAHLAMECFSQTCQKRTSDWSSQQPPLRPGPDAGPIEQAKWRSRLDFHRIKQQAARTGDVFSSIEMAYIKAAVRQYAYSFGPQKPEDVHAVMNMVIDEFPGTPMAQVAANHIQRAKEMMLHAVDQDVFDDFARDSQSSPAPDDIPHARTAQAKGKSFVLDLATATLLSFLGQLNSEEPYRQLVKTGKGDLAWDGTIVTLRRAKALTIRQESHRALACSPARWCNSDSLPEKVLLPYSLLVITSEDTDYLVTILKTEPAGITVTSKKLTPAEAKGFYPPRTGSLHPLP
jgi:hypothetical protein